MEVQYAIFGIGTAELLLLLIVFGTGPLVGFISYNLNFFVPLSKRDQIIYGGIGSILGWMIGLFLMDEYIQKIRNHEMGFKTLAFQFLILIVITSVIGIFVKYRINIKANTH